MGDQRSKVSRVRSGASHRSGTLVTTWRIRVTGIEFIKDYLMRYNGNNNDMYKVKDKTQVLIYYPEIPENFEGWGLGEYMRGWDWEGSDNPLRVACYRRQNSETELKKEDAAQRGVTMRVRLRSSHNPLSARNFNLMVEPTLNGDATVLKSGSVNVNWKSDSSEEIVEITTGGALPDEVSRHELRLTWSVKDMPGGTPTAGVAGAIGRTRHTIYTVYEDQLDPEVSNPSGKKYWDTGLTRQRLDKLTKAIGGEHHRFSTLKAADVDELVWRVMEAVHNSKGPPYFYGDRPAHLRYGEHGPEINLIDQWVMWLESRRGRHEPAHWNAGACITYIQLVKTMLAAAGINSQRAWVHPKTSMLPNGHSIKLTSQDLLDVEGGPGKYEPQVHEFIAPSTKVSFYARVVLVDKAGPHRRPGFDQFEGCLYRHGKLYPGGFPLDRYPDNLKKDRIGFSSAKNVMEWWRARGDQFQRFLAWRAVKPWWVFFDVNGKGYDSPYDIPDDQRLPLVIEE